MHVGFRSHWRLGILLLFSMVLISACGGSDSPGADTTEGASSSTAVSAGSGSGSNPTPVPEPTSSGGGGSIGLNDALEEMIALYEEMLDVLVDVTDEASARDAVDDVARIAGQFEELERRMGNYSEAEIASAAISSRFRNFGQELGAEILRISANPEAIALLGPAFSEFEGNDAPSPTPASRPSSGLETTAPVAGVEAPTPNVNLSAGGIACQLFGGVFAEYSTSLDPTKILNFGDSVRALQESGEAADEPDIREAVKGMIESIDNGGGVPDETIAKHFETMNLICSDNYSGIYLEAMMSAFQR